MFIVLTEESSAYLRKKGISNLLIDVTLIEEPCTQIYDANIRDIKSEDIVKFKNFEKVIDGNLTLYLTEQFLKIYGKLDEYKIDLGGFFKKILILKNVEPIIKNTCRI
jgi:hypothetical protein